MNDVNDDNVSVLSYAVRGGYERCVEILLRAGADVNSQDKCGITPQQRGAMGCSPSCMKILEETGADVNTLDSRGDTPLVHSIVGSCPSGRKIPIESGADVNIPAPHL